MNKNDILAVAVDTMHGKLAGEFSKGQASDSLRQALVDLNGGSTKLNLKTFHRGSELFQLVEDLITVVIEEGFKSDNPLFNLVEYKNIADGDVNEFYIKDQAYFAVANAASGIRDVRRQRISGGRTVRVDTAMKTVRVYENLGRLLAGRISWDEFVDGVARSFNQQMLSDAYYAIASIGEDTTGLGSTYVVSGTYDEDTLLELVEHVEAATGKTAKIYGTKTALRKIETAIVADEAKSDVYSMGYYGKFNGTDLVALKQAHKVGSTEFILDNNKLFVIAGDDKPVKVVTEGEGYLISRDASENADLTQEYVYAQEYGCGVICASKLGVYTIA